MTTLYLEWGGDLQTSQKGGLVLAEGWDEVRQRIERRMLTNPKFILPDGTKVKADYIFDVNYGLGLRRLINQNPTNSFFSALRAKALQGVQQDASVDTTIAPTVTLTQTAINTYFLVIVVTLANGTRGKVAFSVQ